MKKTQTILKSDLLTIIQYQNVYSERMRKTFYQEHIM
jgi:hypothetical protein